MACGHCSGASAPVRQSEAGAVLREQATQTLPAATAATAADPSDRALARRASMGDRGAFAEIFRRHGTAMFRYAVYMLDGDDAQAEDAVQSAWVKAWQHIATFRGESELRTWLFGITAHEVLSARRRRRPIAIDDELLTALPARRADSPEQQLTETELWGSLQAALAELPWRQRASWVLRELEGLSYEEIAVILDTSSTVVRGQLHRARRTLAVRMAQWR